MVLLVNLSCFVVEMLAQLFHVMAFVGEKCVLTGFHIYRAAVLLIWPVLRTLYSDLCHTLVSAYTSWVAHRLSGTVTSVESLLSMAVAHVWALLDPVLISLRPTALMMLHVFTWTTSVVGYRVVAVWCFILVVTTAVVVYRKILKCTGEKQLCCVVCYTNKKEWMVRPCNHVCLCFECTTENIHHLHDRCPMCRGEI